MKFWPHEMKWLEEFVGLFPEDELWQTCVAIALQYAVNMPTFGSTFLDMHE